MDKEKEKAWGWVRSTTAHVVLEEPTVLEENYWKHGFDAGVKAVADLIKSKPHIEQSILKELFPQEEVEK